MVKKSLLLAGAMLMTAMAVNAHAFSLQISTDGTTWQTITDNSSSDTDVNSGPISFTTTTMSGYNSVKISSATENALNGGSLYTNSFKESGTSPTIYVKLSDSSYNLTLPITGGVSTLTGLTRQNTGATADLKTDNSGGDVFSKVTAPLENTPVPEPGTLLLLGAGMFFLAIYGKRHLNNKEDNIMPTTA